MAVCHSKEISLVFNTNKIKCCVKCRNSKVMFCNLKLYLPINAKFGLYKKDNTLKSLYNLKTSFRMLSTVNCVAQF